MEDPMKVEDEAKTALYKTGPLGTEQVAREFLHILKSCSLLPGSWNSFPCS